MQSGHHLSVAQFGDTAEKPVQVINPDSLGEFIYISGCVLFVIENHKTVIRAVNQIIGGGVEGCAVPFAPPEIGRSGIAQTCSPVRYCRELPTSDIENRRI